MNPSQVQAVGGDHLGTPHNASHQMQVKNKQTKHTMARGGRVLFDVVPLIPEATKLLPWNGAH